VVCTDYTRTGWQHKGTMLNFDEVENLTLGDSPNIFPSLNKMWNFNSLQNTCKWRKNNYYSSSSNRSGCTKALCRSTYCTMVLSPELIPRPSYTSLWQSDVEYLWPVIGRKFVLCLHHWSYHDFVNTSHSVSCTNVLCPHNSTYSLCIFAISSKTSFLDIIPIPLCSQPLV